MIKHEQPDHAINATYEDIRTSRKSPQEITFGFCGSPYGRVFVAKTQKGLSNLEFMQNDEDFYMDKLGKKFKIAAINRDDEFASATVNKIYNSNDELNLHLVGTQFQLKVWQTLLNLGRDRVCSYTEIAQQAGYPASVRAVANAIAKNPVHYLVPCHRVLRKNGALGGYAGGLDKKKLLLTSENLCNSSGYHITTTVIARHKTLLSSGKSTYEAIFLFAMLLLRSLRKVNQCIQAELHALR